LRDGNFDEWVFPLFLAPIGNTLIEDKTDFKSIRELSKTMVEAIVIGWRISLDFSRKAYRYLVHGVRNSLLRRFIEIIADKTFNTLEIWIRGLEKSIDVVEEYSEINIRSLPGLIYIILSNILK